MGNGPWWARWAAPAGVRRPRASPAEAESQRLDENRLAADNSAPHLRLWWWTPQSERDRKVPFETEFSFWVRLGKGFPPPAPPQPFLFNTQPSLPACRSCLPRPHSHQTPPALHQSCYPETHIGASDSRWGLKTRDSLFLRGGRKDSLALRRPLFASCPSAAGNSRKKLLLSSFV